MDEVKIRKFVFKKIVLTLTTLLFLLTASKCESTAFISIAGDYTNRIEINIDNKLDTVNMNSGNMELINRENISLISGEYRNGSVSYSSSIDSFLKNSGIYMPVKIELTDDNYIKFSGLKITRGTYFSEAAYNCGRNVAVISEEMAARLFMSLNAIGNEIELLNEKYKIIGLYKNPNSLISLIGSDGAERVYIPFTSFPKGDIQPIDTVYIKDKSLEKERFRENEINSFLKRRLNINTGLYKITDYYNAPTMVNQLEDVLVFLIAIWCICLLARFIAANIKKNAAYIKSCLKDKYAGEFLKTNKFYVFSFIFVIILLIASAAGIFLFARPDIFIPARYIPQENIFDIGFYFNIIKSTFITANSSYSYIPTQLEKYYSSVLCVNALIFAFAIPAFLSVVSSLMLLKITGGSGSILFKAVVISCISACVLSVLFSIAGGAELVFPLNELAVILVFCLFMFTNPDNWSYASSCAIIGALKSEVGRDGR